MDSWEKVLAILCQKRYLSPTKFTTTDLLTKTFQPHGNEAMTKVAVFLWRWLTRFVKRTLARKGEVRRHMRPFEEQLARVERWLKRIEATDRDRTEYEDFLWAFFQNCWHLKDWIKNDGKLPTTITGGVENDIRKYDSLKMCRDICNKSKHFELNRKPAIGATARGDIGIQVGDSLQGSETAATTSIKYKIVLDDGSERDALDVARTAVNNWSELLTNYGLI